MQGFSITGSSTTVAASLTDLLGTNGAVISNEIGGVVVNMEVQNTGANDFTDFVIQLKDHASGVFYNYLVAADFISTTNYNMIACSTALDVLAAGTKGHIIFRIHGAYAIQAQAKRTTTTTAVILANGRMA